jgi:hypothetical protein
MSHPYLILIEIMQIFYQLSKSPTNSKIDQF